MKLQLIFISILALCSAMNLRSDARRQLAENNDEDDNDSNFLRSFLESMGMIFATEMFDKTFFLAALMASKTSRIVVFLGAFMALVIMTVLSTAFGAAAAELIPIEIMHYSAIAIFVFFALKMLKEAYDFDPTEPNEELAELELELGVTGEGADRIEIDSEAESESSGDKDEKDEKETPTNSDEVVITIPSDDIVADTNEKDMEESDNKSINSVESIQSGENKSESEKEQDKEQEDDDIEKKKTSIATTESKTENKAKLEDKTMWAILFQVFSMTFFAEWGDRSQFATITLASTRNVYGVTLGGIIGHGCCTFLAVLCGKFLSTKISERTILIFGGILFLLFAGFDLLEGPEDE
eukprot:TRINITY_DN4663_c0_g3_i1.p1 TRINITY_DN4663_c0_g3~~TRINITY_DN4663_c0_g3_i1.p1  ORF type:complete len:354 (-),score=126.09 TRINITY_DN4663_c0_g3_i1:630-1691(-)